MASDKDWHWLNVTQTFVLWHVHVISCWCEVKQIKKGKWNVEEEVWGGEKPMTEEGELKDFSTIFFWFLFSAKTQSDQEPGVMRGSEGSADSWEGFRKLLQQLLCKLFKANLSWEDQTVTWISLFFWWKLRKNECFCLLFLCVWTSADPPQITL